MLHPHQAFRRVVGVVAIMAVGALAGCSAEGSAGEDGSYGEIADRIAEYAASVAEKAQVPAVAIGIITDDGLVEQRHIGSNAAGDPVTSETMFEIGSSSKAFLGATEAILVDRGDIDWNDRVVDHYPNFAMNDPWVTEEFRIADLLAQRSGLHASAAELTYFFGFPWADSVDALGYLEPVSSFRSEFAYQNIPHYIAGEIVADKTGAASWNEAVGPLLFDRLEMTSTGTDVDTISRAQDTTRGHTTAEGQLRESPYFGGEPQGAGSIVSNLSDMSKWIGMHLAGGGGPRGEVVSTDALEETYRVRVPVIDPYYSEQMGMGAGRRDIGYATGWFVHSLPEGRVIEHGGNTYGYNSAVMFDADRGVGLVVLSNQGSDGGQATHIGKFGMDLIQSREPLDYHESAQEARSSAATETAAGQADSSGPGHPITWYEGVYEHPLLGELDIRADGDELHTRLGPERFEAVATHQADDVFTLAWYLHGDPTTNFPLDYEARFAGRGERADRLVVDGFTFERTGS